MSKGGISVSQTSLVSFGTEIAFIIDNKYMHMKGKLELDTLWKAVI
jgi:hypothetical protein